MEINICFRAGHQNPFGHNDRHKRMQEDPADTRTQTHTYTNSHTQRRISHYLVLWWIKNEWFQSDDKQNEVGWWVHVEQQQQQQVVGWLAAAGDNQVFHNTANWQLYSTWWFTIQLERLCVAVLFWLTHYDRLSWINEFSTCDGSHFFCFPFTLCQCIPEHPIIMTQCLKLPFGLLFWELQILILLLLSIYLFIIVRFYPVMV